MGHAVEKRGVFKIGVGSVRRFVIPTGWIDRKFFSRSRASCRGTFCPTEAVAALSQLLINSSGGGFVNTLHSSTSRHCYGFENLGRGIVEIEGNGIDPDAGVRKIAYKAGIVV